MSNPDSEGPDQPFIHTSYNNPRFSLRIEILILSTLSYPEVYAIFHFFYFFELQISLIEMQIYVIKI